MVLAVAWEESPQPYDIQLINWKKLVIEMKLTSHMRSKARETYWGSDIPSGPSGIW